MFLKCGNAPPKLKNLNQCK